MKQATQKGGRARALVDSRTSLNLSKAQSATATRLNALTRPYLSKIRITELVNPPRRVNEAKW